MRSLSQNHKIESFNPPFLTKKELSKKSKEWLRANPVGIEIIKADVIDDPAGNEREEAN